MQYWKAFTGLVIMGLVLLSILLAWQNHYDAATFNILLAIFTLLNNKEK